MSTLVAYSEAGSGRIGSYDAVYATARTGGSLYIAQTSYLTIGQTTGYYIYEAFTQYNTSSIGAGKTISSVTESLYLYSDNTDTNYSEEVRLYDWGTTLDHVDWGWYASNSSWVSGASITGLGTLVTSLSLSPSAGYNVFPSSDPFIAGVNVSGNTKLLHSSDRHRLGTTPTNNEQVTWYSQEAGGTTNDPKMTVEYSLAATPIMTLNKGWW